jgi:hypothetical protein
LSGPAAREKAGSANEIIRKIVSPDVALLQQTISPERNMSLRTARGGSPSTIDFVSFCCSECRLRIHES